MKDPHVPITPGDTPMIGLMPRSRNEAWRRLVSATIHIPHENKADLINRGYTVEKWYGEY